MRITKHQHVPDIPRLECAIVCAVTVLECLSKVAEEAENFGSAVTGTHMLRESREPASIQF